VIDAEGEQIGAMATSKALRMAEEAGLDLVEVAPNSRPPVCRILDYGKFKYEQKKKARGKPKSTTSVLKEIRVRPKIDVNDVAIKVRKAREFLEAGHKVQVTCLFRGREMAYQNLGRDVLTRVVEMLSDIARLERNPRMEGRRMNLLLARKPGVTIKLKPTGEQPSEGATRTETPTEALDEATETTETASEGANTDPEASPEADSVDVQAELAPQTEQVTENEQVAETETTPKAAEADPAAAKLPSDEA
jgi:translation initiation factor IF-3